MKYVIAIKHYINFLGKETIKCSIFRYKIDEPDYFYVEDALLCNTYDIAVSIDAYIYQHKHYENLNEIADIFNVEIIHPIKDTKFINTII